MQTNYRLAERAVLMRLSVGLPGEARTDRQLTGQVQSEHSLGSKSGRWLKNRWPEWALEPIKKLVNEARQYHATVTLPFDAGIGILPAALVVEYGDKMRKFKGQFDNLIATHFEAKYSDMVEWARKEHNGTFCPDDYPDVSEVVKGFYMRTEPLPVPDASHFEGSLTALTGLDTESVNLRVQDAMQEAQRELLKRMIAPVRAMADKLREAPKEGKDTVIFRDTLVGNVQEIAQLAGKLNIAGDATIDQFAKGMQALTLYGPEQLRKSTSARSQVAAKADEIAKRMAAYNL